VEYRGRRDADSTLIAQEQLLDGLREWLAAEQG
jgi:hypothetical protein